MDQFSAYGWATWEWMKATLALLGLAGLTVGSTAAAAYGLFRLLGEKWIDQKFEKQLEAYKTEQSRELERLRHNINAVFDRTIRLHSKEFEVLPDLWGKLVEAHGWAWSYIMPLQSYPDIGRMDNEELEEFLAGKEFSNAQKRDIAASSEKLKTYIDIQERYRYAGVMDKITDFNLGFRKSGIFVKPEVKSDMASMLEMIRKAVIEHQINQEEKPIPRMRDHCKRLDTDGKALFEKIEAAIADRLWFSTTAEV
jgi:hypothetical protein